MLYRKSQEVLSDFPKILTLVNEHTLVFTGTVEMVTPFFMTKSCHKAEVTFIKGEVPLVLLSKTADSFSATQTQNNHTGTELIKALLGQSLTCQGTVLAQTINYFSGPDPNINYLS